MLHPALNGIRHLAMAASLLLPQSLLAAEADVSSGDLWGPALRMLLSLGAVLAVLAGCAWLAQRLRSGGSFKTGLIEVVSGISLGGREKVVLLRVGGEEVLVGISPAGMRPLHVLNKTAQKPPQAADFSDYMENAS